MERKQLSFDDFPETPKATRLAEQVLIKSMEELYEENCQLVATWMHIQLSHEKKTLEEVGLMLARNFLIAHSVDELEKIGTSLWEMERGKGSEEAA